MDKITFENEIKNARGNHFKYNDKEKKALMEMMSNEKVLAGVTATLNKKVFEGYPGALVLTTKRTIFLSRSVFTKDITLELPLPEEKSFLKQGTFSKETIYVGGKTFILSEIDCLEFYSAYKELLELQKQEKSKNIPHKNTNLNKQTKKNFSNKSIIAERKKIEKELEQQIPELALKKELNSDERFSKLSNENQTILLQNKKEFTALKSVLKSDETVFFISRATYMKEHAVLTFAITKYNIQMVRRSRFFKDIILTYTRPKIEDYTFINNPFGAIADIKIDENILKIAFDSNDVYRLRDAYNKMQD